MIVNIFGNEIIVVGGLNKKVELNDRRGWEKSNEIWVVEVEENKHSLSIRNAKQCYWRKARKGSRETIHNYHNLKIAADECHSDHTDQWSLASLLSSNVLGIDESNHQRCCNANANKFGSEIDMIRVLRRPRRMRLLLAEEQRGANIDTNTTSQ